MKVPVVPYKRISDPKNPVKFILAGPATRGIPKIGITEPEREHIMDAK